MDDIYDLKEAIIELYLAIKIRSTEEVSSSGQFTHLVQFTARLNHGPSPRRGKAQARKSERLLGARVHPHVNRNNHEPEDRGLGEGVQQSE